MENEALVWTDFLKDLSTTDKKVFDKLSVTAQQRAFDYWMKTQGEHLEYNEVK